MISLNHDQAGAPAVTLADLDRAAAEFEDQAAKLDALIHELETDLEAVRKKHLPALKRTAGAVAGREAALLGLIEAAPELFVKPRTALLHGVKVGYTTSQGRIVCDDEDQAMLRIDKHFKDRVDELIRVKRELNRDALRALTAAELVRAGCRLEGAGDVVVLKRVAGDVEKLVNKLIARLVETMKEA